MNHGNISKKIRGEKGEMNINDASKGIGTGIGIAAMGIGLGIAFDTMRNINKKTKTQPVKIKTMKPYRFKL